MNIREAIDQLINELIYGPERSKKQYELNKEHFEKSLKDAKELQNRLKNSKITITTTVEETTIEE